MKLSAQALHEHWVHSTFHRVYGWNDIYSRGRCCIMLSGIFSGITAQLSGSLFLTRFLLSYGMDKSRIGILTFVPYLACLFNVFSPLFLERFRVRRRLLIAMKLAYYAVNILGVTLLPTLVRDTNARLIGFVILVFAANALTQLAGSGWTAWHASFLPEKVRVDYFQWTTCIQCAVIWLAALGVSFVADRLSGTPNELILLTAIRYITFFVGVADCLLWLIPKEFPYRSTAHIRLSNIFRLPLKNRKFLMLALMLALYHFATQMPNATLNVYLLEEVHIPYSLITGMNSVYFLFFFVFAKPWKRFINKLHWYRAFGWAMLMESVTFFVYSFVTKNTDGLFIAVRLSQHVLGVLINTITGAILYLELPDSDRTYYLSFYTILANGSIFISMMLGTALADIFDGQAVSLFGFPFSGTQLCILGCAAGEILVAVMAFHLHRTQDKA